MAVFRPVIGHSASVFENVSLIYIHCVSKDDFSVRISGLEGVEVVFRLVHISFLDKFSERRVALVPTSVENCSMDTLFNSVQSPTLIRLSSTSNIRFFDPKDDRQEETISTVLWKFDILSTPTVCRVAPISPSPSTVDHELPPLDLRYTLTCNCFTSTNASTNCLSSFELRQEYMSYSIEDHLNQLTFSETESIDSEQETEHDADSTPCTKADLQVEYFKIKGSFWESRYQDAFKVLSRQLVDKIIPAFRVFQEPNNLVDKNAQRFDILDSKIDTWIPLGYCPVEKIPKLIQAQSRGEITDIKLASFRRRYISKMKSFMYEGALNIVKRGKWEKTDPANTYNSDIYP